MIDVHDLTKRYGNHTAIERVNFHVEKGEVVAFLGPNGAGKTTTMRILSCFMPATEGTAQIAGFDCFENPQEVKCRIGYLPEFPPLYLELTVTEYLTFVGRIKGMASRALARRLSRVIDQLSLGEVRGRLIGNLSKGFRQRVGFAQALIHDPPVLILDEPTAGLDPKQIIDIRELMKELAGSHTILLSTHILPEATAVCQRVLILNAGRIVAEDTPEHLSARFRQSLKVSLQLHAFPSHAHVTQRLQDIPGVINVITTKDSDRFLVEYDSGKDLRSDIAKFVVHQGWELLEFTNVSMTLEDVFLRLTQNEEHSSESPPPGRESTPSPSMEDSR